MKKKYLIIKLSAIGDVLMCLHVGRFLKENNVDVDWAVGETSACFVEEEGFNQVIILNERKLLKSGVIHALCELFKFWKRIIFTKYDLIFLAHSNWRYLFLILPKVLTSKIKMFNPVKGRNHVEEYIRSVSSKDAALNYIEQLSVEEKTNRKEHYEICIAPGGAKNLLRDDWQRRWPIKNFKKLIDHLNFFQNVSVSLLGSDTDRWILDELSGLRFNNFLGNHTLIELRDKINKADLFITQDSGPMHVGFQTTTPVLSIFGPTDDREKFLMNHEKSVALKSESQIDCMPCYNGRDYVDCTHHQCMNEVSVEFVSKKVEEILNL